MKNSVRIFSGLIRRTALWLVGAGALAFLSACIQPAILEFSVGTVNIEIEASRPTVQAVSPVGDLTIALYEVTGNTLSGASFSDSTIDGQLQPMYLAAGLWTIEVQAVNPSGITVGYGSETVLVRTGESSSVSITVGPVAGAGTLALALNWNADLVVAPAVAVELTGFDGETIDIPAVIDAESQGTVAGAGLASGYYQMAVRLIDSTVVVAGLTEMVRIADGMATEFAYVFDNINKVGKELPIENDSFTLAWDPPSPEPATGYRIYVRERGTEEWAYLVEVAADAAPSTTITTDILAYGRYEFAVSSVSSSMESRIHTSMDDDAMPATGWFVNWTGP
jgi:hypothetical protein